MSKISPLETHYTVPKQMKLQNKPFQGHFTLPIRKWTNVSPLESTRPSQNDNDPKLVM